MRRAFLRLLRVANLPSDTKDERLVKGLQIAMACGSVPAIATWGLTFVAMGHPELALWHAAYIATTLLLLGVLVMTRRMELFRTTHITAVLITPFCLHWQLGGFVRSGGAMLWCLLAPVAAMMFVGAAQSLAFFLAIVVMTGLTRLREGPWATAHSILSPAQISTQFAVNVIGFTVFLYFSTRYFVSRLEEEKLRADALLANILPGTIAERLKREETTIAERYDSVTVLFTDLVGFTLLSASMPPQALVALLDEVFSGFDAIVGRYGLEKIKTIGDAYMAVGGLPEPSNDHATRVADAALEMAAFVERFARQRNLPLAMRIGMHSGEVVAGVIGRRKFSYDLWGDTVNTASRMESHGAAGRVHVSDSARLRLDREFDLTERGVVTIKGKGEMRTHWLNGRRAIEEAASATA